MKRPACTRTGTGTITSAKAMAAALVMGSLWMPLCAPLAAHAAEGGLFDEVESPAAASAPVAMPRGTRVLKDQPYGEDRRQRFDVYLPAQLKPGAPVWVMVHGGAWRVGDKGSRGVVGHKAVHALTRGAVFVSVNYRMLPRLAGEQADDVAQALAAVQAAAPRWGADPSRVLLMGHSAGAHLVALLAAQPARALALGAQPWLGTVALDSAALDVPRIMQSRHMGFYDAAFGRDPNGWRDASPADRLTRGAAPMLLVCSSQRRDNPCAQAQAFAAKAHALDVRAEVLPQDLNHAEINATLGQPGAYTDAVDAFWRSLSPALAAWFPAR